MRRLGLVMAVLALACGSDGEGGGAAGGSGATGGSAGSAGAPGGAGGSAGAAGSGGTTSWRFAVIGDYGDDALSSFGLGGEQKVAEMVRAWQPDFVITTGDNNYPNGAASTIDANIGKHYAEFIGDYQGSFGPGSAENRFWPCPGNHDWNTPGLLPYLDYFTLPDAERYYEKDFDGLVHLFAIDSDGDEPDGTDASSTQAQWFQQRMQASTACWKIATMHHPPYSSGDHGSSEGMRWPYADWGVDAVLAGHDHTYERSDVNGTPYFVVGLGGSVKYQFKDVLAESQVRYNEDWGAMLVTASKTELKLEFFALGDQSKDVFTLTKSCP